jgi:hypothetical protein
MRLRVIALGLALALPLVAAGSVDGPRPASASVAINVTLDELVIRSAFVVVATAAERHSAWENLAGGRRIVTYTKLKVDQSVVGEAGSEVWVRTLGGAVGKIGQHVSGEARITMGSKALFFLAKSDGALVVTGLAQGHYPIVTEEGRVKLASSPDTGKLLPAQGPSIPARDVLIGATLESALGAVQRARRAQDARK